jgi:hypothetical protein
MARICIRLSLGRCTVTLHISFVERQGDLLTITFADGRCALYTAELLVSVLPQAIQVLDREDCQKGTPFDELPRFEERTL